MELVKDDPKAATPEQAAIEEVSADVAARVLERERKSRQDQCGQEISALLQKYNCEIGAELFLQGGAAFARAFLRAK